MKNKFSAPVKIVSLTFILMMFVGCSSKELYESTQPKYSENECRNLPPYEYDDCINKEAKSFEEYKKERTEIIEEENR
jgi:hypothetical protein